MRAIFDAGKLFQEQRSHFWSRGARVGWGARSGWEPEVDGSQNWMGARI